MPNNDGFLFKLVLRESGLTWEGHAAVMDDFPQHLETQIISKPIQMTHFR